jgi:hypothetical protein
MSYQTGQYLTFKITEGYSYNGSPKQFTPYVEFFMNEAFEEVSV